MSGMGNYDAWKLASPPYCDGPDEDDDRWMNCGECMDLGYELDECDHAVPCSCCSVTPTLDDIVSLQPVI